MKITKHGKKFDDGTMFKGTCDMCECKVEVTRDEIKMTCDDRDGDYHWVKCPECNHVIYINDKRL